MKAGRAGTVTDNNKRHGTATPLAGLNTRDGRVISLCQSRRSHAWRLASLRLSLLSRPCKFRFQGHVT